MYTSGKEILEMEVENSDLYISSFFKRFLIKSTNSYQLLIICEIKQNTT